jgi:murein DD-endopeptidase MepM/ murein hydrolase activator NlpD
MHYSMDKSTYFATLDQYKYNPATIFSAEEGTAVTACAQGKVTSIFENEEIGKAVTLDLGDGYEATYGQLTEITVKENSYVNPGDTIGSVAAPTKYYSTEGSNVYFALTHNGEPVNGEALFRCRRQDPDHGGQRDPRRNPADKKRENCTGRCQR